MEPRKHLSCTVERATGITNALSLSLTRAEIRSMTWSSISPIDRSIDRFSAFTNRGAKAILTRQHKRARLLSMRLYTRARIMERSCVHDCAGGWTRVMARYCCALLFWSTEFSRRGRRFAVTRGACRQGEESRRREGEDDKDGEGKRGKRMFARK